MLSNDEIIDLWRNKDYAPILNTLNIHNSKYDSDCEILLYVINICNIELITEMFTICHIDHKSVTNILLNSNTHDILIFLIENNLELQNEVTSVLEYCMDFFVNIAKQNNIQVLNIILAYCTSDEIIQKITHDAINHNNLNFLDILSDANYNIKLIFEEIMDISSTDFMLDTINFSTFMLLEKYNININIYLDNIAMRIFWTENLPELELYLEYGANVNYIMSGSVGCKNINVIEYLLNHGADINCMDIYNSSSIIGENDRNLNYVIFLIEHGFDITEYINDMIIYSVTYNNPKILQYLINIGADIHFENELALFYACRAGYISCVEILLDNGADIYVNNGEILLFSENQSKKYSKILSYLSDNIFEVAEFLIKKGAIISDPIYLFCLYLPHSKRNNINQNCSLKLFILLLEYNIDLNAIIANFAFKYIFELAICF